MYFRYIIICLYICLTSLSAQSTNLESQTESSDLDSIETPQDKARELYLLRGQYYHDVLLKKEQEQENKSKNGLFVGVSLGTSGITINKGTTIQYDGMIASSVHPLAFGVMGGYLHFIGKAPMGIRVYGQYLGAFNISPSIKDSVSMNLLSVNIDLVGEIPIGFSEGYFFGAYIGIGAGVNFYNQETKRTNGTTLKIEDNHAGSVINIGLSVTLNHSHRIEAGIKTLPKAIGVNYSFSVVYLASYQYLF